MSGRHAVVVGGGIGGLAVAVALQRRSWQVTVLEKQSSISEIGAGITLWPNALRALDALGVGSEIRSSGLAQISGGIRDSHGKWLSRTDTDAMASRFGDGMVVLDRGNLLSILREAATGTEIRTSAEVKAVDKNATVTITSPQTGAGERIRGDLVIGADGAWSAVRASLWPDARVRPVGMTAWRLIGRVIDEGNVEGGESWGRGDYAGLTPLPDNRIYAWFVTPVSALAPTDPNEALAWLRQRFGSWHTPLPELLNNARPDDLLRNELHDLEPLGSLVSGNVALVGDAAHAMTPNLGQGACLALEDGVELAAALDRNTALDQNMALDQNIAPSGDIARQLRMYDSRRLARVHRIARRSRTAGTAAALRSRTLVTVRNALVTAIPAAMSLRTLDPVVGWRPPQG
jgi:2-polyprenyl-6-methoxyphenol hydroxylase-like FAD-dependent oxidoreductase